MAHSAIDLQQLLQKCFDNHELVNQLVSRFQVSLEHYEAELSETLQTGDFQALGALAHRLAGESGTMCAWSIHETAKALCQSCRTMQLELVDELLDQLAGDIDCIRQSDEQTALPSTLSVH